MTEKSVSLTKAMHVVGLLKTDRKQWRKAFEQLDDHYDFLSDDYANTLKELRGTLDNGDLTDAFDLIDDRLNSLD